MIRRWNTGHLVRQILALAMEWVHWTLGLVAFELLVFLVSKRKECLLPNGERSFTAPCNTIYAAIAFGGVLICLNLVAALAIGLALQLELGRTWWRKYCLRTAHDDNVTVTDETLSTSLTHEV